MTKKYIQTLLTFAFLTTSVFAACRHETCSDSIEALDPSILQAIADKLDDREYFDDCRENEDFGGLLSPCYYLYDARCSAKAIHAVYTQFADQMTPDQAKYLFSRAPEARFLLDTLVFGLEHAKRTLEDMPDYSAALEHVLIALNKSKVTHCPHCYVKIIIPAIDSALADLEVPSMEFKESDCSTAA